MNLSFMNSLDLEHGGNFILMCGPPGSGKTTAAEQILHRYENFVIVSPDKIREEVTGDSANQTQNDVVFSRVYGQLKAYLEDGKNVIYDATNCRSVYRYKILDVIDGYTNIVICVMSTTPISECLRRNAERERKVPEAVIERMYFTLHKHPPIIFEGYDMIVRM